MILVSEIYGSVIQGEGAVAGTPTVFVRLGGCDYECVWCDSLYAVQVKFKHEWSKMSVLEVLGRIRGLAGPPILVTLSGGNPALQDCGELITRGQLEGYTFAIETQGTKCPAWARYLDSITISPKPPSSRMTTNFEQLHQWLNWHHPNCSLKVVVFDDEDLEYARVIRNDFARRYSVPMYVQAGTSDPYMDTSTPEQLSLFRDAILRRTDWLGQRVIEERWTDVRVLPQIHALIYGAKRGV